MMDALLDAQLEEDAKRKLRPMEPEEQKQLEEITKDTILEGMHIMFAGYPFIVRRIQTAKDGEGNPVPYRIMLTPDGWRFKGAPSTHTITWAGEKWDVHIGMLSATLYPHVEDDDE